MGRYACACNLIGCQAIIRISGRHVVDRTNMMTFLHLLNIRDGTTEKNYTCMLELRQPMTDHACQVETLINCI